MNLNNLFNQTRLDQYTAYLRSSGLSDASLKRKLSSLTSFQKFLIKNNLIENQSVQNPPTLRAPSLENGGLSKKFSLNLIKEKLKFPFLQGGMSRRDKGVLNNNFILRYIAIFSLFVIGLGLGFTLYRQAFTQSTKNFAYTTASNPTIANRQLSFQGRLTDSSGNPITSSTTILFKLYDTETVGTGNSLYTSATGNSQTVTPDENGIFSVVIGKTHGTQIPNSVFTENSAVYLEITAGGETMSPRQPIATVAYALNSETLQGLPPSASGLKNTVLVIDELGNINLGETSPTIKSTSGTLGIEAQAVLIKATDGSGGNITINPDANGIIKLTTEGSGSTLVGGFIDATNANLATGNLFNATINNTNRGYKFINFSNYNIGTTQLASRFSVDAYGNTNVGGTLSTTNLTVGSSSLVSNLNADLLDGQHASNFVGVGQTAAFIYSASNGLSLASNTFRLGGLLTQNTDIGLSGFSLSFSDGGSTLVSFSSTGNTFYNPTSFLSGGDVSMAYNLNFTNSSGSNINTAGPFAINTGEVFGSSNLTLKTYNSGKIVMDSSAVNIGGTLTLSQGASNGYLLTSDANGNATWTSASGIGGTDVFSAGNGISLTSAGVGRTITNTGIINASNGTLTRSGSVGSYTLGLNLANANTWTGAQTFGNLSIGGTFLSVGSTNLVTNLNANYLGGISSSGFVGIGQTGNFITNISVGGSGLSISGSGIGRTLTNTGLVGVTNTTLSRIGSNGNYTVGLNLANANIWTALQTFTSSIGITGIAQTNGHLLADASTDNLLFNGDFEQGTYGWTGINAINTGTSNSYSGNNAAQMNGYQTISNSDYIPIDPKQDVIQLEAYIKKLNVGITAGMTYFGYYAYDINKTIITSAPCGTYCYFATSGWTVTNDGNWHKISATRTGEGTSDPNFPVGTRFIRVMGLINLGGSTDSQTLIDHVILKRINTGPLFVGNNFSGTNMTDQYQVSKIYTNSNNQLTLNPPTGGTINLNAGTTVSNLSIGGTLTLSQGASNGYLLTSDNYGVARWTAASGIGGTDVFSAGNGISLTSAGVGRTITNTGIINASNGTLTRSGSAGSYTLGLNLANANNWTGAQNFASNVGIGTTNPGAKLEISDTDKALNSTGNLYVKTTNNQAIDLGGQITFGGAYTDAGDTARFAAIAGRKENGTTGFASGYLQFSTSITTGGVLTEKMRITSTGNVGIGTTAPNSALEVNKAITFTNMDTFPQLVIKDSAGQLGRQLGFGVDAGNFSFIQSMNRGSSYNSLVLQRYGGNVGIGITSPTHKLDVVGDGYFSNSLSVGSTVLANNLNADLLDGYHASSFETSLTFSNGLTRTGNDIHLGGELTEATRFNIGSTEVMYFATSGDVSIGATDSESSKLHIYDSSKSARINLQTADVRSYITNNYDYLLLAIGNGEIAARRDNGNVGIGLGNNNPTHKLDVVGDAYFSTNLSIGGTFLSVGSTNLTTNLNADLLDGYHASNFITNLTGGTDISITSVGVGRTINNTSTLSSVTGRGSSTSTMLSLLGGAYFGSTSQSILKNDGSVGIGTTNPTVKLDVNGGFKAVDTSSNIGFVFGEQAGTNRMRLYSTGPSIRFISSSDSYANLGFRGLSLGANYSTISAPANGTIIEGNVGIGTTNPTHKLDVVGNGSFSTNLSVGGTLTLPQGASNGYLLKSDSSGNSTWVDPSTLGIGITYSAGVGLTLSSNTFNIDYDSTFGVTGNKIGLNLGSTNVWTAIQTFNNGIGVSGVATFANSVGIGTTNPNAVLEIIASGNEALKVSGGYIDLPTSTSLSNDLINDLLLYLPLQSSIASSRGNPGSFTRTDTSSGSSSTYTGDSGYITHDYVYSNVPRFERTKLSHGVWIENGRRNLLQYESFEDAGSIVGWTNSGLETFTTSTAARKHQTYSAQLADTNSTGGQAYRAQALTSGQSYPFYCYALNVGNTRGVIDSSVVSLYANGVVSTNYTEVDGGWYRISGTVTGTGANVNYGVSLGSNQSIYLDGCQIESDYNTTTGVPYGTSLIYNNSTNQRNRGEETLYFYAWRGNGSVQTTNNIINSNKGTISLWFKPEWAASQPTTDLYFLQVPNVIQTFFQASSDSIVTQMYNGSNWTTVSVASAAQTFAAYTDHHLAVSWDNTTGVSLTLDGIKTNYSGVWTDQKAQIGFNTILYVGSKSTAGGRIDSLVSDFAIFKNNLSDSNTLQIYNNKSPINDYQRSDILMLQQNNASYQRGNIYLTGAISSGSIATGTVSTTFLSSNYFGVNNAANITSHLIMNLPFENNIDGSRKEIGTFSRPDTVSPAATAGDETTLKLINKNANEARIDRGYYSNGVNTDTQNSTGNFGVHVEESRKNIALNSSFESMVGWTGNGTVAYSQSTAKTFHGTYSVNLTSTAATRFYQTINLSSVAAGTVHQISAYVYRNETNVWGGTIDSTIAQLYARTDDSTTALATTYTTMGNGWYRLTAEFPSTALATWDVGIQLPSTGRNIYVDSFQVERLSNDTSARFPTTYIPTNGSTVTRATESLSYQLPSSFKTEKGSFSLWFKPQWTRAITSDTTDKYLFYIPNAYRARLDATNDRFVFEAYNGTNWTTAYTNMATVDVVRYGWNHFTCGWYYNYMYCRLNGNAAAAGIAWTPQTPSENKVYIGSDNTGANQANGQIAAFSLFDAMLDTTQLNQLWLNRGKFEDYYRTDMAKLNDINSTVTQDGSFYLTGNFRSGNGTQALPSFSFNIDSDTGMYTPSSNSLAFSVGGTNALTLDSTGAIISNNLSIGGTFLSVGSTNLTTNLNSDLLDGYDSSFFERILSFSNGLTRTGNNIHFGGDLTENTRLNIGSTEVLYIQNNTGNIGIGTTTPTEKLEVAGNVKISGDLAAAKFSDGDNSLYYLDPANASSTNSSLSLTTSGSLRFNYKNDGTHAVTSSASRIQNFTNGLLLGVSSSTSGTVTGWDSNLFLATSGNIGIGTTNPTAKLEISGANVVNGNGGQLKISSTDTMSIDKGGSLSFGGIVTGTTQQLYGEISGRKENATDANTRGYLSFSTSIGTGPIEEMRLNSNGYLGIGTTNPLTKLQVNVGTDMNLAIRNGNYDPAATLIQSMNDAGTIITPMELRASKFSIMAGNVGIGTTNPTTALDVNGVGRFLTASVINPSNTLANVNLNYWNDGTTDWPRIRYGGSGVGSANGFLIQGAGDSVKLAILNSGNVGIGTTNPTNKLMVVGNDTTTHSGAQLRLYEPTDDIGLNLGTINGTAGIIQTTGSVPLSINPTANNVGIGTTDPSYKLDVNLGATAAYPLSLTSSGKFLHVGALNASYVHIDTDATSGVYFYDNITTASSLIVASTADIAGSLNANGNIRITNASPTIYLQDSNGYGGMIHQNSNMMMFLSTGSTNASTWTQHGSYWPLTINTLDDAAVFGGVVDFNEGSVGVNSGLNQDGNIILNGTDTWLRTTGNTGWYSTTYDSGVYSTTANRVDLHPGDSLYVPNTVGIGTGTISETLTVNGSGMFGTAGSSEVLLGENINNLNHEGIGIWHDGIYGQISSIDAGAAWQTTVMAGDGGNVSIGAAPSFGLTYDLEVHGNTLLTGGGSLCFNDTSTYIGIPAANTLSFYTSSTERVRINNAGFVTFYNGHNDLAENYLTSGKVLRGSLVSIDQTKTKTIQASTSTHSSLIGVVSTAPGAVMDEDGGFTIGSQTKTQYENEKAPIALVGTVPTLVTSQNGIINIGDAIGISNIPGFGAKTITAGNIVGRALENLDTNSCTTVSSFDSIVWPEDDGKNTLKPCFKLPDGTYIGKIMITLSPSWYDPDVQITATGDINVNYNISDSVLASLGYSDSKNEIETATYKLTDSTGKIVNRLGQFSEIATAKIKTGLLSATNIVTKKLISEKTITQELVSPKANIDQLTAIDIQTTSITTNEITTDNLTANEATISTLYADNIISKEGSFGNLMAEKVSAVRDELKKLIEDKESSSSAITGTSIASQTSDWRMNIASDSAEITGDLTITNNLIIGAKLLVNGDTQLANAFITGTFSAGEISIKDNFIETTNTALYIQPSNTGSIHMMGETLVIAENGEVQINGNLAVSGSLFANLITASEIQTQKLTATEINSNQVKIATDSAQTIIAESGFAALATSSANLTSNATAGTATLPVGKTEIIINNNKITNNSMVYITPVGSTKNQVPYIKAKVISESESYFTIALDNPLDQDIEINWWIIN